MAKQTINVGTLPNDGTGDTLLSAMNKINANFTDLYTTSYSTNVVNSFNSRQGVVSLLSSDVTGALGYTPISNAGGTFTGLIVMNNGFVSNQAGVFDSNLTGVGSLPSAPAGTMIRAINLDTNQSILNLDSFINAGGTMSAAIFRGSRGTGASPSAIQSTDIMGQIGAIGYGTTQFSTTPSGQINFVSEGAFTNASTPTAISFQVTPSASASPSEQMRLTSLGNLILSGTGALQLPAGTTGQQPSPSVQGMLRYNTTTSRFEFYNGASWVNHVKLAGDTMTGTLTVPALVGTTGASTLDSFVIGSITPEAGTFTALNSTSGAINATSVGATTAGSGAFTTLSASSTVSGAGFSSYITNQLAAPPAIGGTTPNTGAFTTLTATTPVAVSSGGTGRATLTAHDVLIGNGTTQVTLVAPSTAGQALISAGATSDPLFGFPTGTLINVQRFTSSGTYTPTTGTNSIIIYGCGGGGGGGGTGATSASQVAAGGAGSGGSWGISRITSVASQTVTIGAAGAAGAAGANAGGTGGQTSIGTYLVCAGGLGGAAGTATAFANATITGAPGGQGSTATSSGTLLYGSPGSVASYAHWAYNGTGFISSIGASGPFGSGGWSGNTASIAGSTGLGNGSGGSGALAGLSQSALAGGAGTAGIIIVYEYA